MSQGQCVVIPYMVWFLFNLAPWAARTRSLELPCSAFRLSRKEVYMELVTAKEKVQARSPDSRVGLYKVR